MGWHDIIEMWGATDIVCVDSMHPVEFPAGLKGGRFAIIIGFRLNTQQDWMLVLIRSVCWLRGIFVMSQRKMHSEPILSYIIGVIDTPISIAFVCLASVENLSDYIQWSSKMPQGRQVKTPRSLYQRKSSGIKNQADQIVKTAGRNV